MLYYFPVVLGDTRGTMTTFHHSIDNTRDYTTTDELTLDLKDDIVRHLVTVYDDLKFRSHWALLLGYDGGRKRAFSRLNFDAFHAKIDSMPMRQREMAQQRERNVACKGGKRA